MPHPAPGIKSQLPEALEAHAHRVDAKIRTMGGRFIEFLPGILLCIVIGFAGRGLGSLLPALGGATCAILLGVIVGNVMRLPARFTAGVRYCESRVLECAVAFMGFGLSFTALGELGWRAGGVVLVAVSTALGAAFLLSRFVNLSKQTVWLIGIGTAICGSSAIAAVAPLIAKERREVGISVGVVSILGMLGILGLPLLISVVNFDPQTGGVLIGGTLQAVAHVVAAGFSMGEETGNMAVAIKMGRVAMLVPLMLYLTMRRNESGEPISKANLPWYLVGFLVAAALVASGMLPAGLTDSLHQFDKLLLTVAMAAIGLSIRFDSLEGDGTKAIACGAAVWFAQIMAVVVLLSL